MTCSEHLCARSGVLRVIAILGVFSLAIALSSCKNPQPSHGLATGQAVPLPPVGHLPEADSTQLQGMLVTARGHPVVINLWASWCVPCRTEMPRLQNAHQQYGAKVVFIGVAINDQASDARIFLKDQHVTYGNVIDISGRIPHLLGADGLPTTYVTGKTGKIRGTVLGGISEGRLHSELDAALKDSQ